LKRHDDDLDDLDQDDGRNRTFGSNTSYQPSFGGGGTLTSTFSGMLNYEKSDISM
jgi:hypothetical protein